MERRKVKNGEKSPWGQCLTRPVPSGRCRSGFWLVPEKHKFSGTNQKSVRPRPFRLSLARTICPWVSEDGPTLAKRRGSGRIFYLCNPFRRNVQILHRLQYCLQLKNFTVPRVACKEKADPCKFLAVQNFLKGIWVLTRVLTSSTSLRHWICQKHSHYDGV